MKHLGTSRIITFIHKYLQLWLTDIADPTRTTCKHHIIINFLIHISPHHNNLEMKLGEGYDNIIDTPATTHTDLHRQSCMHFFLARAVQIQKCLEALCLRSLRRALIHLYSAK